MDLASRLGHINYAGSVPGEWQATVFVSVPALRRIRLLSTPLQLPAPPPPLQLLLLLIQHEQTYIHISFSFCNLSLTPLILHFLCPGPTVLNGPQLIGWPTPSSSLPLFVLNYMTAYMKGGDDGGRRGVSTSGPPSLSNRLIKLVWEKVP